MLFRTIGDQERVSGLEYPSLSELYRELYRRHDPADVLVIPHAHNPGDYRQSDTKLETLVEMISMHGAFEWFVKEYLAHGHQVGVIGGSDDHLSHPGYSAPSRDSLAQRGGLAAVMAPTRSRDAIFDALKARRTYATSGERILLELALNGVEMGQRAPYAATREIVGRVIGTAPIQSIRLTKNNETIWERDYAVDPEGASASVDLLLSFHSGETPFHPGDAPRGWRHWRGDLTVAGAQLDAVVPTDFFNPTTQRLERRPTAPVSPPTPAARTAHCGSRSRRYSRARRSLSISRRRPRPDRRRLSSAPTPPCPEVGRCSRSRTFERVSSSTRCR